MRTAVLQGEYEYELLIDGKMIPGDLTMPVLNPATKLHAWWKTVSAPNLELSDRNHKTSITRRLS